MDSNGSDSASRSVSRRDLLRLAGGLAAGGAAASLLPAGLITGLASSAQPAEALTCGTVPGNFGRMFPGLKKASWSLADLDLLASAVMAADDAEPTPEGQVDDEENADIDAGFTYIGQFIDHDLTFDNRPDDLITPTDPTTLANGRTPMFDLDNVYGSGPVGSPDLYQPGGVRLKLGAPLTGSPDHRSRDLPRDATGRALLGDPRDDENRIVAGVHSVFLRFHNLAVDVMRAEHPGWHDDRVLAAAQRFVRLHYQWAVLTDFLPTIVGQDMVRSVLPGFPGGARGPRLRFFNACNGMPVEFSVAAYRFGHSMVRPIYRINQAVAPRLPVFSTSMDPTQSLGGFQPSPPNFAIDWKFFFLLDGPRKVGQPQASYRFDNSLVFPLSLLPLPATGAGPASLAKRNLMRAVQLGLPSGQDVARAMGLWPLRDDQILIGKATGDPADATAITNVSHAFSGKAPLWTYVLAEATAEAFRVYNGQIHGPQRAPFRLGPVGGRIVAETFAGVMAADPSSVLNTPDFEPHRLLASNGRFGFRELIRRVTALG
jgi:hypothetical protein